MSIIMFADSSEEAVEGKKFRVSEQLLMFGEIFSLKMEGT